VARTVRVDEVEPSRVTFTWWPAARPADVSTVELVVLPRPDGSTLRVTETTASAAHVTVAGAMRWDVRLLVLLAACAPALV
jgi:hypothetical protein